MFMDLQADGAENKQRNCQFKSAQHCFLVLRPTGTEKAMSILLNAFHLQMKDDVHKLVPVCAKHKMYWKLGYLKSDGSKGCWGPQLQFSFTNNWLLEFRNIFHNYLIY